MNASEQNKQNQQERVIPKLRFPEFQTALGWENRPLSTVFNRITLKNKENNQNVLTISAQYGLISQLDFFNKSVSAKDITGYYLLHKGDFAYNKSYSNGYPYGAIKPLKLYDKGVVSTLYICFKPKESYSNYGDFFEHYFEAGVQNNDIGKVAQEGARNHGLLNIGIQEFFNEVNVLIPSFEEQQKIADCLSSLDELIELQEQKLVALKQHKKGLMQQLFPSHNDLQASKQASKQAIVYPKLRFPQFRNCKGWEVVELRDVGDFVKEKIEVINLEPQNYISTENLLSDYGGVTASNKLPATEKVTAYKKNDILVSNIRPYLKKVWQADKNGGASNDIIIIRAKPSINISFLSFAIKNDDFIDYMMKGAKGVKMPRGDLNLISIFPVAVPTSPKEQQAIADCLSSLDNLINEQNERIGRLKTHKKGLMQQLFPNI